MSVETKNLQPIKISHVSFHFIFTKKKQNEIEINIMENKCAFIYLLANEKLIFGMRYFIINTRFHK